MEFPKTLDAKPFVTDGNENKIVDFTFSTLKNPNFEYVDMIICTGDTEMRADLMARLAFGGLDRLEELLKSNGVSNPFAIKSGEVFLVPDLISSKENFTSTGVLTDIRTKIKMQYIDKSKAPDTSKMKDALDDFAEREKTALPPNFAKEGDKEMLIKDGVIVFGPNVTRKRYKDNVLLNTEKHLDKVKKNAKNIKQNTKTFKK